MYFIRTEVADEEWGRQGDGRVVICLAVLATGGALVVIVAFVVDHLARVAGLR